MSNQVSSRKPLTATASAAPGGCCGGGGCGAEPKKDGKEAAGAPTAAKSGGLLVNLGNTKCPVMGGKSDGRTWSEWNGLRVGHCCPGCRGTFGANPEKCLTDANIEWKAAAAAAKAVDTAKGADRVKALAALKAKWTVLREPAPEMAK